MDRFLGLNRDDFTLHSFGCLAIILDMNGKLAAIAVCTERAGATASGESMLARFSGRLYGMDLDRLKNRSQRRRAQISRPRRAYRRSRLVRPTELLAPDSP